MKTIAVISTALAGLLPDGVPAETPGNLPRSYTPGQYEISIYDLPAGSFDHLGKAVREHLRRDRIGTPQPPPGPREDADRYLQVLKAQQAVITGSWATSALRWRKVVWARTPGPGCSAMPGRSLMPKNPVLRPDGLVRSHTAHSTSHCAARRSGRSCRPSPRSTSRRTGC